MARAIEQIDRDLGLLKEAIRAIAAELENAYANYLSLLGQAVRQQLILATYHLCTQGYPENFLSLSLNQRQKLQQAIRQLGQKVAEQLLTFINNEAEQEEQESTEIAEPSSDEETENIEEDENNNSTFPLAPLRPISPAPCPDTSNPIELAKWQQNLEKVIQDTLKKVSHNANVVLQKIGILPKKLPEPILEVAAAASEASGEVMPGPPNLLNLVIEIENEQDEQPSGLTRLMAINLRLSEIEFADAKLSSARKQIRNHLVQLNKLGHDYQKKQRERSIAEAEAAWRAIWIDD
jgi:hypothetical protein